MTTRFSLIALAFVLSACEISLEVTDKTILLNGNEHPIHTIDDFEALAGKLKSRRSSDKYAAQNEIDIGVDPNAEYLQMWLAAVAAAGQGYGSVRIHEGTPNGAVMADLSRTDFRQYAQAELPRIEDDPDETDEEADRGDPIGERKPKNDTDKMTREDRKKLMERAQKRALARALKLITLNIHLGRDSTMMWLTQSSFLTGPILYSAPSNDRATLFETIDLAVKVYPITDSTRYSLNLSVESDCPVNLYFDVRNKVDSYKSLRISIADSGSLVPPVPTLPFPWTPEDLADLELIHSVIYKLPESTRAPMVTFPVNTDYEQVFKALWSARLESFQTVIHSNGDRLILPVRFYDGWTEGVIMEEPDDPEVLITRKGVIVREHPYENPPARPLTDISLDEDLRWYVDQYPKTSVYATRIAPLGVLDRSLPFSDVTDLIVRMLPEGKPLGDKKMFELVVFELF